MSDQRIVAAKKVLANGGALGLVGAGTARALIECAVELEQKLKDTNKRLDWAESERERLYDVEDRLNEQKG